MMFNIKLFKTHKPRAINIIGRCSSITIEYMSCLMSVLKSTHNHIALNYRCPYIIVCVRFRQHPPRQSQNANTWTPHNVQYKLSKTCKPRAINNFFERVQSTCLVWCRFLNPHITTSHSTIGVHILLFVFGLGNIHLDKAKTQTHEQHIMFNINFPKHVNLEQSTNFDRVVQSLQNTCLVWCWFLDPHIIASHSTIGVHILFFVFG